MENYMMLFKKILRMLPCEATEKRSLHGLGNKEAETPKQKPNAVI